MNTVVHVGFGNYIQPGRVAVSYLNNSAHIKRMVEEAESRGLLVDMTSGRRTKGVLVTDTGFVILVGVTGHRPYEGASLSRMTSSKKLA